MFVFIHAFEECLFRVFMKIFCKKVWILGLFCLLGSFFLTSCTSTVEADGEIILKPDTSRYIVHKLYPNDLAKNDSAAANVARGIMLIVNPGASYKLSFDVDPDFPAPELQLFRPYSIDASHFALSKVRTLSPTIVNNRYVYSFVCEEKEMTVWYTSLGNDGKYYEGKVKNISFTGTGSYDDHFSLNLIVVGAVSKTADSMDVDELSRYMLNAFREKYNGVTIDTLYVHYAHNHPTLGQKYPANYPWEAGKSSDDFFMGDLASSIDEEHPNALNVFFVHSITGNNVMGLSKIFNGALGANKDNSVVVGEYVHTPNGELELQSSYNIVMTMIHEVGHSFGLRHTSATKLDMKQYVGGDEKTGVMAGDWSNIDDGLTDTPFCEYILRSGLYKQADGCESIRKEISDIVFSSGFSDKDNSPIYQCADRYNIMFPVTLKGDFDVGFSDQQMEIIRSTLSIIQH